MREPTLPYSSVPTTPLPDSTPRTYTTEQQVLVLPAGHPLTGRSHLSTAEIGTLIDLPLPRWRNPDGSYSDGTGTQVRDHTQLFQLIALGRACALVPESARAHLRDGHATVPVPDAPTVTTAIAWPPHTRSRAVAGLVRTATRLPGTAFLTAQRGQPYRAFSVPEITYLMP